jgi:hypothetical protein
VNMTELLARMADERVTARFVRFLVAEGVIPSPRRGRANAEYGNDHIAGISRYLSLRDLGLSASRAKKIVAGTVDSGIPIPISAGLTLIVDPAKISEAIDATLLLARIAAAVHLIKPEGMIVMKTVAHTLANSGAFLGLSEGAVRAGGFPIPLVSEKIHVTLRGGLALVARTQVFRNEESGSIEATLTFPMPVHATLCRLSASIDGRTLTAIARSRKAAREHYEAAIDAGKTAVLHEEVLRGIHSLSVAHIPAGAEVKVTHSWIAALAHRGTGAALLRIPVTLGQVYGDSPLNDAEDLFTSPHVIHEAVLTVDAAESRFSVAGHRVAGGKLRLRLDRPIDILVEDGSGAVRGVTADGSPVTVRVTPSHDGDSSLDVAILVDRSGSMGDTTSRDRMTKHEAVVLGLRNSARLLRQRDRVELWEFDSMVERVAGADTDPLEAIDRLGEPRGGTEIGVALATVLQKSPANDIILITDGLCHALDVQSIATSGRRFTVVLVGADSLEANVGRLAALTGGEILIATGAGDAGDAVRTSIASIRRPKPNFTTASWPLAHAATHIAGSLVEAIWGETVEVPESDAEFASAVGAFAASLALPQLTEGEATGVAIAHGIVSHLTSLVLIDEAGTVQDGVPAQRKVPLMDAGSLFSSCEGLRLHEAVAFQRAPAQRMITTLSGAGDRIHWNVDPEALRRGDISSLPPDLIALIIKAAELPAICAIAGVTRNAIAIVVGLIAASIASTNRSAERIARAILRGIDDAAVAEARTALGLPA